MTTLTADSPIISKTKELCNLIAESPEFAALQGQLDLFFDNKEAQDQYRMVQSKGEELQQKQMSGLEISQEEIGEFENMRQQLFENETAAGFISAQQEMQNFQQTLNQYISLTLQNGKVPTEDEIAEASSGGCCGGSGGGSCGC